MADHVAMIGFRHRHLMGQAGLAVTPILFVVVLLAVLVGAIATSGTFTSGNERLHTLAATVIAQGNEIYAGAAKVLAAGVAGEDIELASYPHLPAHSLTSANSIFASSGGNVTPFVIPKEARLVEASPADGRWSIVGYSLPARIGGIGVNGANDLVAAVPVTDPVCNEINRILYGKAGVWVRTDGSTSNIDTTNTPDDYIQVLLTDQNMVAKGTGFALPYANRFQACVERSPTDATSSDIYYQVLEAR